MDQQGGTERQEILLPLWRIFKWSVFCAGFARLISDLLLGLVPILLG